MTAGPNLQELIDTIRRDAGSDDALAQLAAASTTVTKLSDTGDAALGYFVDQARGSGHSWVEISNVLGVSKQAAHKRFAVPSAVFDRYTDRARHVVDSAGPIAREHRHAYVGTEHLLRAFFVEPECVATNVLAGQGVTQEAVEATIQAIVPDGDTVQDGETPLTPRASHVLQAAPTVAVELGHNYVGTEHILLALYRYPGGVAPKVLTELGLDEDTARTKVTEALA